ncbi:MAG: hypothetical protein QXL57_02735 [Candidatus Bathyarchaeia archaeon]
MKKKKETVPKRERRFTNKKLAIISSAIISVIALGIMFYQIFIMDHPEIKFSFNAAIIDQVGANPPSDPESAREFNETVTRILEDAGFTVFYYRSGSITVNLYKGLAKNNYGLIILRVHSALREGETEIDFFTSEKFEDNRYRDEQNEGLLTMGNYSWQPGESYFAITPKFIERLDGYFPKSIVIAMGCWSLKSNYEEMAQAFIKKGAKAYIGWTDALSMAHSDNSTIRFLQYLLENNMTISDAVDKCNTFHDPVIYYHAELSYYPSQIGDYKFSDFKFALVYTSSMGRKGFFQKLPLNSLRRLATTLYSFSLSIVPA